ncbi:PRTRC system protein E [Mucilaginibacter gossypiicola]|uniref:PRTRC system protein E n=1 Tax=Mucilaginibacter gossypiicola TaxID=551995 RepID=A0A1H8D1S3_9SPHI|nr:PRTRC system protein E [Mucilaginibacter gossypiicola]SEN01129.1 PRTRC system protein E [Mucilaginibacter gossypiicola]
MQTNFFEHITALEFQGALNLNLIKDAEGLLTVSVYLPNATADTAGNVIPPMILKGNPAELGEGFFGAIAAPVKQTASLFANMDAYQQSLKKAAENSKAELDKKNKANKAKTTTASATDTDDDDEQDETENLFSVQENEQKILAEKKKRYATVLEQVAELSKVFKYDEAISLLQTCADYLEKAEEINAKGAELQKHKDRYEAFINDLA